MAILQAARSLFVEHGYDRTTLAMVARKAEAAMGSLTHFYKDKAHLAAAVHADAMEPFIGMIAESLRRNGPDVSRAIKDLIRAVSAWNCDHPDHQALVAMLGHHALPDLGLQKPTQQARLEQVLADWAGPIRRAKLIAPLDPKQLYAIILAPTISSLDATVPSATLRRRPNLTGKHDCPPRPSLGSARSSR